MKKLLLPLVLGLGTLTGQLAYPINGSQESFIFGSADLTEIHSFRNSDGSVFSLHSDSESGTFAEACAAAAEVCIPALVVTAAVALVVVGCGVADYEKYDSQWTKYVDEADGVCLAGIESVLS